MDASAFISLCVVDKSLNPMEKLGNIGREKNQELKSKKNEEDPFDLALLDR